MSNSTPTQRGWYLLGLAESASIKGNFDAVSRYTDLANAYFNIVDTEELESLTAWIANSAVAAPTNSLSVECMSVTGAAAPTDAQVKWDFGDGPTAPPAVISKALTTNMVTLTLAANHNLVIGQKIFVALTTPDAVFDGLQVITATTPTTISYAKTNANVVSAAAPGTIVQAGVVAFHTFSNSGTFTVTCTVAAAALPAITVARDLHVPYAA